MPHLIANRPRLHDLLSAHPEQADHFLWETINAVAYKIGGVVFVAGSILFFPELSRYADLGAGLFVFGSLLYLIVNLHDLAEVRRHWGTTGEQTVGDVLETVAVGVYLVGTLLFIAGSIFFLSAIDWIIAGGWCFIAGSLLFLIGASVNVLQIVQERSLATLQLMNLTAVSFIAGSVLFTVASVPYLWSLSDASDRYVLATFGAWQFVFGSALFLLGGVLNYWRAYVVMRAESA